MKKTNRGYLAGYEGVVCAPGQCSDPARELQRLVLLRDRSIQATEEWDRASVTCLVAGSVRPISAFRPGELPHASDSSSFLLKCTPFSE